MASRNLEKKFETKKPSNSSKREPDTSLINTLNDACLVHIFNFLIYPRDLVSVEKVCRRWRKIMASPLVWQKVIIEDRYAEKCLYEILEKCGDRVVDLSIRNMSPIEEDIKDGIIHPFECLDGCPNLRCLCIDVPAFIDVLDIDLDEFNFFKKLKSLTLRGLGASWGGVNNKVLKNILELLTEAKDLENLTLCDDDGMTAKWKFSIKKKGKIIKFKNFDFTHKTVVQILERFPDPTYLKVGVQNRWDEKFSLFKYLAPISNQMTSLNLTAVDSYCFKGDGLKALKFNNLKKLKILDCTKISDDVILILAQNSPLLEHVHMFALSGNNTKLTDAGYRHFANCKNLISMAVGMPKITEETVKFLAENCKNLKGIYCLHSWKQMLQN